MPRRRINVSKLFELKQSLAKAELARERAELARQRAFDLSQRRKWQAAIDRAWWGYQRA